MSPASPRRRVGAGSPRRPGDMGVVAVPGVINPVGGCLVLLRFMSCGVAGGRGPGVCAIVVWTTAVIWGHPADNRWTTVVHWNGALWRQVVHRVWTVGCDGPKVLADLGFLAVDNLWAERCSGGGRWITSHAQGGAPGDGGCPQGLWAGRQVSGPSHLSPALPAGAGQRAIFTGIMRGDDAPGAPERRWGLRGPVPAGQSAEPAMGISAAVAAAGRGARPSRA